MSRREADLAECSAMPGTRAAAAEALLTAVEAIDRIGPEIVGRVLVGILDLARFLLQPVEYRDRALHESRQVLLATQLPDETRRIPGAATGELRLLDGLRMVDSWFSRER
jgi:hypothetical protein